MLRLTLDLVPFGIEKGKRNLYTIEIWNVGPTGVDYIQDGEPRYSYGARTVDEKGNKENHGTVVRWFDRRQPAYVLVNEVCKKLEKKGAFGNV